MERYHYLDFQLRLSKSSGGYLAIADCPAGEAKQEFQVPFSPLEIENLTLKLTRLRSASRGIDSPEMKSARDLGSGLFRVIFQGQVGYLFRTSLDKARASPETGLRLKLRIEDAPDLGNLPWEFLFDPEGHRFLAQSIQTPIVRYVELPVGLTPLRTDLPVRILGMIASPSDYRRLDVEHEKTLLESSLAPLLREGIVTLKWVEQPTLPGLHRELRLENYHIFHYIGHGGFDTHSEQGVLVFENEKGFSALASAERLGVLLYDHRSLRLAILNSCEGARNSTTDPFAGVATTLVRQGLPAVIAMQFEISDEAAITFASQFYENLALGYSVDTCVAEARKAIYIRNNEVEWGTPVLYLRAADGVLFDLPLPGPKKSAATASPVVSPVVEKASLPSGEPALIPEKQKRAVLTSQEKPAKTRVVTHELKTEPLVVKPAQEERTVKARTVAIATTPIGQLKPRTYRLLKGFDRWVNQAVYSPDGSIIATASGGQTAGTGPLRLWQASSGKPIATLTGHKGPVHCVAFSPDGGLLASGSWEVSDTLRLWQVSSKKQIWSVNSNYVQALSFSPDGRWLACGHSSGLDLWDVKERRIIHNFSGVRGVTSATFSWDGKYLAYACHQMNFSTDPSTWDGSSIMHSDRIEIWQVDKKATLWTLERSITSSGTTALAFSPDGKLLASGLRDVSHSVQIWKVVDKTCLVTLQGGDATSVAFSPDGCLLATSSYKNNVRLWNVSTWKLLCSLEGHTNTINQVAFSPDGRNLASASQDRKVRLWHLW